MEIKKELSERVIHYLDFLEKSVKDGGNFLSEQAPLVIQELIMYERILTTATCVALFLLLIFCTWFCQYNYKKYNNKDHYREKEMRAPACIFSGFAIMLFGGIWLPTIGPCIKAWCAPRLIVLESLKKLL